VGSYMFSAFADFTRQLFLRMIEIGAT